MTGPIYQPSSNLSFSWKAFFAVIAVVVLLSGVAFVAVSFGKQDALKQYNQVFNTYKNTVVTPILNENKKLRLQVDSLNLYSESKLKENESLKNQVSVLKKQVEIKTLSVDSSIVTNDRVLDSLIKSNGGIPVVCKPILTVAQNYRMNIDSLKLIIESQNQINIKQLSIIKNDSLAHIADVKSNNLLKQSNDSLVTVIKNWPVPPKEKLLGIFPSISPTSAFEFGGIVGIIITLIIHH